MIHDIDKIEEFSSAHDPPQSFKSPQESSEPRSYNLLILHPWILQPITNHTFRCRNGALKWTSHI